MVLTFGSYFGEFLVRNFSGKWERNKDPDLDEWLVNVNGNKFSVFHIAEEAFTEKNKFFTVVHVAKKHFDNFDKNL